MEPGILLEISSQATKPKEAIEPPLQRPVGLFGLENLLLPAVVGSLLYTSLGDISHSNSNGTNDYPK
ncbi:MAG: hypothetical protein NZ602_09040 [Thermoguttaceae bacterium]|nr:hypothetical protein [Thermoguttaceae bacterium]MDW8038636.1 hypothetical protein [Thermoguttaceae bacterium]